MKIIVTHTSPDWDGITSIWLIKKFLPGWEEAGFKFVPAGERLQGAEVAHENFRVRNAKKSLSPDSNQMPANVHSKNFVGSPRQVIEEINGDEVIHVDTGLGALDHHQTASNKISAASLTWNFVQKENPDLANPDSERIKDKIEAIKRMVKIVVDIDHFRDVFWQDPTADYHEFSLLGLLDGLKFVKPNDDWYYVDFGIGCLEAILHEFENRIWAEKEIAQTGIKFKTSMGRGIAFETLNDTVLKLAQKMGYDLVVRKDPRKGYIRIKARPCKDDRCSIDLTPAYKKLKKLDPAATWFFHVSRHMLLNGTPKNPKMKPTTLTLKEIIKVLEKV